MRRIALLFAFVPLFTLAACNETSIQGGCNCAANIPLAGTWSHTDSTATVMVDSAGNLGDSGLSIERTVVDFAYDGKLTATRNLRFLDTHTNAWVVDDTTHYAGTWQAPRRDTVTIQWTTEPLFNRDTLNFNVTALTLRLTYTQANQQDTLIYTRE